jgi:hypothetical protein
MKKLLFLILTLSRVQAEETPNLQKMWEIIQQQQATIKQLQVQIADNKKQVDSQSNAVEQQQQTLEIIADNLDGAGVRQESKYKFGGYGELHYGNTDSGNSIDFHRFVLFNGFDFNDSTRFYSELEIEHALSGDGKPGEVEVEQAFIEHRFNDRSKMTVGVSLLPIGILNETHEPDTFYGVERNNIEKNIVPATWWAAGIGFSQQLNQQFAYDLYLGEGLNVATTGAKAFNIRSGRQKSAKARANDGAVTARVRYTPNTKLQINASFQYQQDITQGALAVDATLFEINARYAHNNFALRALYARWDLDNKVKTLSAGREQQIGYYLEPSYRFGQSNQHGIFARFSNWDNKAGKDNSNDETEQFDLGYNYWLTPRVVFKLDYQDQSGNNAVDAFHLGMGYSF